VSRHHVQVFVLFCCVQTGNIASQQLIGTFSAGNLRGTTYAWNAIQMAK
jgi:hypothetical protein